MTENERRVSMMCPTCGGEQFSFDDQDDNAPVTCVRCGREATGDQLVQENSERIDSEVQKMGDQIMGDLAKKLRKMGFK